MTSSAQNTSSVDSGLQIGFGSIGRRHALILNNRYQQLAIVDFKDEVRDRAKEEFPDAVVAESLEELGSLGWTWDTTLAVIATWGPNHLPTFVDLAARGVRHILCEKPLAHSVEAGAEIVQIAAEKGIALGTHHKIPYSGFVTGLSRLAEELGLGSPVAINVQGGAVGIVTNGIHYLDMAAELFGHGPESVVATASGEKLNPRSPDLDFYGGTGVWSYGEGRSMTICFTNLSSAVETSAIYYRDAVVQVTRNLELEVTRRVQADVEKFPSVTRVGPTTDVVFSGVISNIGSAEERIAAILDDIESGTLSVFPPDRALQTLGACIGALTSGQKGMAVKLPIDPKSEIGQTEWAIT